jgi:peptidoglycan/xylan/chitin deacetylase (PgdA/CDA1 family)
MSEVRLDRVVTLYFYWPMSRMLLGRQNIGIPILMYHVVQEGTSDPRPYYETYVSPRMFAQQMRQLRAAGYEAVSIGDALAQLRSGKRLGKLVVITFDDGYRNFYQTAFPVLKAYQFTATVFLVSSHTGNSPMRFKGKECLTWGEIRELHSQGIQFGSHTVTHPELKFLARDQVEQELEESKKTIEDHLGAQVDSFSYPYAFPQTNRKFTHQLRDLLLKNGYSNGVTTILGTANTRTDPLFLPRLPVNRWDDEEFFRAKLGGGYNWLHSAQQLSKQAGRLLNGYR